MASELPRDGELQREGAAFVPELTPLHEGIEDAPLSRHEAQIGKRVHNVYICSQLRAVYLSYYVVCTRVYVSPWSTLYHSDMIGKLFTILDT